MGESIEEMRARWAKEALADDAAIALGRAYRGYKVGVRYWPSSVADSFRAGYEAGVKAAQVAEQKGGE